MQKRKQGCLTWIGYVFIAILIMVGIGLFGSGNDDEVQENIEVSVDSNKNAPEKESKPETNATFETGKIYNGHKCKFKLSKGDSKGFSIEIENESKKDYSFDVHSMSINGIMTNCNIYTGSVSVPSGKKGMMEVDFDSEWLDGIDTIEYADFIIWAYDDAKSFKDFETDIIRIKTDKFRKEKKFKKEKDSIERNGLLIKKESIDNEKIKYSIINKNNYRIETDLVHCSINDTAFEPGYSAHDSSVSIDGLGIILYPGSKTFVSVDISEFMQYKGDIKNFEFSLKVRENEDYFKETETKKIKFK